MTQRQAADGALVRVSTRLRRMVRSWLADDDFIRAMAAVAGVPLPPEFAVVVTGADLEAIERWLADQAPHTA